MTGKQLKQDVYSQLIDIAQHRGYKRGWVANQYRKLFDVWPRGLVETPKQATEERKRYITHRNIAWAKRKEGHHEYE